MSLWSRIANVFRGDRLSREIDEELQSHIEEAIAQGRDPAEARRAFGAALRLREESRDVRLDRVARLAARRRHLRLAATEEEQGGLCRGHPLAGAGDRGLHGSVPADRRPAAAALAGVRSRPTVRAGSPVHRAGWQTRHVRRLGVSGVPADARRGEGSSRVDRHLLCRPHRPDLRIRPGVWKKRTGNMFRDGCSVRSGCGPL